MAVSKVLLYPNINKKSCLDALDVVSDKLHSLGIRTIMSVETQKVVGKDNIKADEYLPVRSAFESCDIAVILGGDGTMLTAAHTACITGTPLLGINLGTLGYMSELEIGELSLLDKLNSGFEYADRMMIDITIEQGGTESNKLTALNDALISRGAVSSMVRLSLNCDGSRVANYRADGLIISTPTGSSAYCMSAGGPIIDTKLDAFCVVPICSHSLSGSRALVFSPNSVITVQSVSEKGGDLILTADGRFSVPLTESDRVIITKSKLKTRFVKLKKDAFYDALNRKLI
ncbi:MAG TPA: NAD(+) kinase [Clostridiales bacterium]|nr:NAD(+) kinase [Clostridiales bacterium]